MRDGVRPRIHKLLVAAFECILFSSLVLVASGQARVAHSQTDDSGSNSSASQVSYGRATTFRVHSDLVLIPVTVTDGKGRVVTGLNKEQFTLFEDKREQTITHFASEDAPASIGIVFDTSDSMAPKLTKAREAVAALLTNSNLADEFFLVKFSTEPVLVVPMTTEKEEIARRVEAITVRGTTALLDAVGMAMNEMKNARYTRKALVIISDGEDNASHCSVHDLKERVSEADVLIYAIGLTDSSALYYSTMTWPPPVSTGSTLLTEIARETGGRLFEVHKLKELPQVASKISAWLRNQYVLGYSPANSRDNGKYHRIQVKLTKPSGFPRLHASWRLGYYAPAD